MNRSLRYRFVFIAVGSIVLFVVAQSTEAQRRGKGGMRYGNVTAVQLLQVPDVQKELKLSTEQLAKANSIYEELAVGRGQVMATIPKEGGKRGPKIAELNEKADADLNALLDAAQTQRVNELLLQVNGANELEKEEVQTALQLNDHQKEQLSDVSRQNAEARRKAMANPSDDRWTMEVELHKNANAKLLEVLTPEQRKQFEAMQGEKFEIDLLGI